MKRTIDMVTRLYVYILKSDSAITSSEIEILYSLLINLFSQVDVSWEAYVKDIVESEYKIEDVFVYLDRHLSFLDKIRLIQSLVIMANTEADFAISDLTEIMELAKNLNVSSTAFLPLIDHFENRSSKPVYISCRHHLSHVKHSVFADYVVFGHGDQADIQFRNAKLNAYECALFAIDKYMFLSVAGGSNILLDGQKPEQNAIHLINEKSVLTLAGREYSYSGLQKMYLHRDEKDDIVFRKPEYEFIFRKFKSSFSMVIYAGAVNLNGKEMSHSRRYEIFYDDVLQIKGYAPFHLGMVIEDRADIGLEDYLPQKLFIVSDRGFLHISRAESENSLTRIEYSNDGFYIYPPRKSVKVFVNQQELDEPRLFNLNTDTLTIDKKNYRINNFFDLIETPFEIESYVVTDIKHYFPDGVLALDSVSFEANKGQMVAILGQSGCGKSTLTKVLSSEITPSYGQIKIDGKDLYSNISYFQGHIAYVPQGDLLYPNLSVFENLWYRIRLRMPQVQKEVLIQKVNNILHQVNLSQHRDTIVGDFTKKNLSGGERKRLNLALELLFEPTIIICDEPTSGLSFNDAEHIIEILESLCQQDKIVILTIHQPNSSIYRKFDRVLMMDMGGKIAFYGTPNESFSYFDEELALLSVRKSEVERKRHLLTSDYFYDIITYPLYDEMGQPVYEQIHKQIQAKRMFPPDYWRDKYKRKMLYELMQSDIQSIPRPPAAVKRKEKRLLPKSYLISMLAFISRSFKMKIRNRTNNLITFIEAPLLGLIISFILRHTTTGVYSFAENNNISIYIFVSIIAFIFLGMSNSIEEILSERRIILRERLMNLKASNYQVSKLLVLSFFGLIQALLYHLIAAWVLGIRGLGFINVFYFYLASLIGNSIGLLVSAFIKENRAIINFLPLILIPQIIFGGAVIEFERMNQNLTLYERHPIPEVVQIVPSRWLFEGLATSYAKNTAFHRKLNRIKKKELTYLQDYRNAVISASEFQNKRTEIYYAKTALAEKWDPNRIVNSYLNSAVSIMDGRVLNSGKNEFLSSIKLSGKHRRKTWNYNAIVILIFALGLNLITWIKLKYYFKE